MADESEIERLIALIKNCNYISPEFTATTKSVQTNGRYVVQAQAGERVIDDVNNNELEVVGDAVTIKTTQQGRLALKAVAIRNTHNVLELVLQYFNASGEPVGSGVSVGEPAAAQLLRLIEALAQSNNADAHETVDESILLSLLDNAAELQQFFELDGAVDAFSSFVRSNATAEDLIAVAHRIEQLEVFRRMLEDTEFFAEQKRLHKKPERAWQVFFESNQWIFGYGLNYIYLDAWDVKKLEQTVAGSAMQGTEKIIDALLKTSGVIRSLCFTEIKIHTTPLLQKDAHRTGVWAPSRDLVEAVSQVQRTVDEAQFEIKKHHADKNKEGGFTGGHSHFVQPRSFLVIGSLTEMLTSGENTEMRKSSDRLSCFGATQSTSKLLLSTNFMNAHVGLWSRRLSPKRRTSQSPISARSRHGLR